MEIRLFFLDDDLIQNEIFNEYLTMFDIPYDAKFTESGYKAVEFLKSCSKEEFPQVFFVDLMMPQMNGWEFLTALETIIKEKSVDPSIYLLSSSVSNVDKEKAKNYTILKSFITKPLPVKNFKKLLQDEYSLRYASNEQ
ncbi:MAG: response regulator [Chitinophagales bacterium]